MKENIKQWNGLADVLLKNDNDIIQAVELYKMATKQGNRKAKRKLIKLKKAGIWKPKEKSELELLKQTKIESCVGNVMDWSENRRKNKALKNQNNVYSYTVGDKISIITKDNKTKNADIIGVYACKKDGTDLSVDKKNRYNIKRWGLESDKYIKQLAKANKISIEDMKLLYCIKDEFGVSFLDPDKSKIILKHSYKAKKISDEAIVL